MKSKQLISFTNLLPGLVSARIKAVQRNQVYYVSKKNFLNVHVK